MKTLLFSFAVVLLDVVACGSRDYGSQYYEEPDYLYVSPDELLLERKEGASGVISVSSNVHWGVDTNNGGWLKVYPNSGDGDGEIEIIATSNESKSSRHYRLMIVGGQITREVIVIQ